MPTQSMHRLDGMRLKWALIPFTLAVLVACAALRPEPEEPPEEVPDEPVIVAPETEPEPPAEPALVVAMLDPADLETAFSGYQSALVRAGAEALEYAETGYYQDVLEARLRQRLGGSDIELDRPTANRLRITLPAFEFDSARPTPEILELLELVYEAIAPFEMTLVSVHGHTDSTGNPDVNRRLSEQRALTVAEKLVEHGIASQRVVAVGHGANRPVAPEDTPAGQALNRRVELWIDPLVSE